MWLLVMVLLLLLVLVRVLRVATAALLRLASVTVALGVALGAAATVVLLWVRHGSGGACASWSVRAERTRYGQTARDKCGRVQLARATLFK